MLTHPVVHSIPGTYLSSNWKFVFFWLPSSNSPLPWTLVTTNLISFFWVCFWSTVDLQHYYNSCFTTKGYFYMFQKRSPVTICQHTKIWLDYCPYCLKVVIVVWFISLSITPSMSVHVVNVSIPFSWHLSTLCLCVTLWWFSQYFKLLHSYYLCYGDLWSVIFHLTTMIRGRHRWCLAFF